MTLGLVLLVALAAPSPTRSARVRPAVARERSPVWGKDPVRPGRFNTMPHATIDAQASATDSGRKRSADLELKMGKYRIPIVGQVQTSISTQRSYSTVVPR